MDADQNEICQFLNSWPDQFVSGKEICRRAGGKWRFREDPGWALPILRRMLESSIVEADIAGRFRLNQQVTSNDPHKKKLWISPAIKRILDESGKDFGVIDLDEEIDPADIGTISLLPEGQTVPFIRDQR